MALNLLIFSHFIAHIAAYTNHHYTISKRSGDDGKQFTCEQYEGINKAMKRPLKMTTAEAALIPSRTTSSTENTVETDPYVQFEENIYYVLYGSSLPEVREENKRLGLINKNATEKLMHLPTGKVFRGELVKNKSGVHLPMAELLHRGYCKLDETKDYMQTAVNAFAIILNGDLKDIERLPSDYVLQSARTISMMKLPREKLAAMWGVVKGDRNPIDITYDTLAKYRPLFKYLTGKEIARLNLNDPKILMYIGTHAALDRHQVGLIASKYIVMNDKWSEPRYLNLMNNLLCGVPMTFIRQLPENTFLQLSHQVFYHIYACDPLQRRFYLAFMMGTQVLGKSYSWSASDVARLGLLLAEVSGPDLSTINPKSMSGITSQVMLTMSPHNLQHLTEAQLKYIGQKPLNILARKLKSYQDQLQIYENRGTNVSTSAIILFIFFPCLLYLTI